MNKEIEFPDPVLSPYTATMILAYLHGYAPPILERRRLVAVGHLRAMAAWLGYPQPQLRSVRHHLPLAAHFALLRASRLASFSGATAMLQPGATPWLHGEWPMQIDFLLAGLREETWQQALRELGLETTIRLDYTSYLQQVLERQRDAPPLLQGKATWQSGERDEEWWLQLPRNLPTWLLFDLLQLGEWQGERRLLHCTALTVGQAMQRGYGAQMIRWLLETATQEQMPSAAARQLRDWQRRAQMVEVDQVYLLGVKQPQQLMEMLRHKRFRRHVQRQLSPRHAVIAGEMVPVLANWLQKRGYLLGGEATDVRRRLLSRAEDDVSYDWLGLRLLVGLGGVIPLPYPPPFARLNGVGQALDAQQRSELEGVAEAILARLQVAVRGRDAFFPAATAAAPALIERIEEAIRLGNKLQIRYQSLGDNEARQWCIEPLRLERRGELYYLHAYCYQAEDERVFRLDRFEEMYEV